MTLLRRILRLLRLAQPAAPVTTDEQIAELRRALEAELAKHDEARHG